MKHSLAKTVHYNPVTSNLQIIYKIQHFGNFNFYLSARTFKFAV